MNVFLHPVIRRANFGYLQARHPFTPRTWTFDAPPLTWLVHGFAFIHENCCVSRLCLRKSELSCEVKFPEWPDSPKSPTPWNCEQIHEQNSGTQTPSANILSEGFNWVRKSFVHTSHMFKFIKVELHSSETTEQCTSPGPFLFISLISWRHRNLRRSEDERFLPNSPTIHTWRHQNIWREQTST
jgi:hypothetical protein